MIILFLPKEGVTVGKAFESLDVFFLSVVVFLYHWL